MFKLVIVFCCGSLVYSLPQYNEEIVYNGHSQIDSSLYPDWKVPRLKRALISDTTDVKYAYSNENDEFVQFNDEPINFQSITDWSVASANKLRAKYKKKYAGVHPDDLDNYSFLDWALPRRSRRSVDSLDAKTSPSKKNDEFVNFYDEPINLQSITDWSVASANKLRAKYKKKYAGVHPDDLDNYSFLDWAIARKSKSSLDDSIGQNSVTPKKNNEFVHFDDVTVARAKKLQAEYKRKYEAENQNDLDNYLFPGWALARKSGRSLETSHSSRMELVPKQSRMKRALSSEAAGATLWPLKENDRFVRFYDDPINFQSITDWAIDSARKLQAKYRKKYDAVNPKDSDNYSFPDWAIARRSRLAADNEEKY